jgi:heme-degrading monooxygenase HmoA
MSVVTPTLDLRTGGVPMIARRWRGTVRAADHDAYLRYVEQTGIEALRATPGNEGVLVFRHLDEATDTSEIEVVSLWRDEGSIEAFAGADISVARFFPDDERYLVDRELTVRHDDVDRYPAASG